MKFVRHPEFDQEEGSEEGMTPVHSPKGFHALFLSWLAGLAMLTLLVIVMSAHSLLAASGRTEKANPAGVSWPVVVAALLISIPLHESLHLVGQPKFGLSDQSLVVLQPAKLRIAIYFDGSMSRSRWLLMRLAPLLFLVILPSAILMAGQYIPLAHNFDLGLQIVALVNCLGSGADLAAITYVLAQVPVDGSISFIAGRAYWTAAAI
jgi:hypothetical protein